MHHRGLAPGLLREIDRLQESRLSARCLVQHLVGVAHAAKGGLRIAFQQAAQDGEHGLVHVMELIHAEQLQGAGPVGKQGLRHLHRQVADRIGQIVGGITRPAKQRHLVSRRPAQPLKALQNFEQGVVLSCVRSQHGVQGFVQPACLGQHHLALDAQALADEVLKKAAVLIGGQLQLCVTPLPGTLTHLQQALRNHRLECFRRLAHRGALALRFAEQVDGKGVEGVDPELFYHRGWHANFLQRAPECQARDIAIGERQDFLGPIAPGLLPLPLQHLGHLEREAGGFGRPGVGVDQDRQAGAVLQLRLLPRRNDALRSELRRCRHGFSL